MCSQLDKYTANSLWSGNSFKVPESGAVNGHEIVRMNNGLNLRIVRNMENNIEMVNEFLSDYRVYSRYMRVLAVDYTFITTFMNGFGNYKWESNGMKIVSC